MKQLQNIIEEGKWRQEFDEEFIQSEDTLHLGWGISQTKDAEKVKHFIQNLQEETIKATIQKVINIIEKREENDVVSVLHTVAELKALTKQI